MTNEEVYKRVEAEKRKKEKVNKMWLELMCPVCGDKNFQLRKKYSMLNIDDFLMMIKGRNTGDADYNVIPYECKECGYVLLRKDK